MAIQEGRQNLRIFQLSPISMKIDIPGIEGMANKMKTLIFQNFKMAAQDGRQNMPIFQLSPISMKIDILDI